MRELESMGINDERVLDALRKVPRDAFVPEEYKAQSFQNRPLPIGFGQTISQPYIVAYMTEILELQPDDKVLEIGTGSGYQAAILSRLVKEVYSIEIIESLAERAKQALNSLDYDNVHIRVGDGYKGWPENAPFDAIILTAAPEKIPQPLIEQLGEGGRLIAPVGEYWQSLVLLTKSSGEITKRRLIGVSFVPMTGEASERR